MKNAFNFISLVSICLMLSAPLFTMAGETINTLQNFSSLNKRVPSQAVQEALRAEPAWQNFVSQNTTWRVHFNEQNGNSKIITGLIRLTALYGKAVNIS